MTSYRGLTGVLLLAGTSFGQVTERVSLGTNGVEGNQVANTGGGAISLDGRFLLFDSEASNLVPGDTNGARDLFLRDRLYGTTERVDISSAGLQSDGAVDGHYCMSGDGNIIAFSSDATNLVPGDTNGYLDVFVRDRSSGLTELVSVSSTGLLGNWNSFDPFISQDGRYVAFVSDASSLVNGDQNQRRDCFVRDRLTGTTERVSLGPMGIEANDHTHFGLLSADGRFVAFASLATNLVASDTNGAEDVFVRDRFSGTTSLVSVNSNGNQALGWSIPGGISSDGHLVVFSSVAPNLVPGDTNGCQDVFVHDSVSGATERVSIGTAGAQANGLCNVFAASNDGRFVAFVSLASNLVAGDSNGVMDGFIRDRVLGITERVSIASDGTQANLVCGIDSMSDDGRFVEFWSNAANLVPGDNNGVRDTFVHDRFATGFTNFCDPGSGSALYCPCMNPPASSGRGCDNSSLTGGASLAASGIAYLSLDSLRFTTHDEKPSATSILLQSDTPAANGLVFGQGIRCAGGALKRMYVKTANNGSIQAPDSSAGDPTISARSAALGVPIQPGQPYYYLVYYRDPIVLGGCSAFATFNCTQTGSVSYWP